MANIGIIYINHYDAEIEYLESTGTQWIDTLIHPLTNYGFELYGGFTQFKNDEFFGGGPHYSMGLGICTHGIPPCYGVVVGTTEVCRISCTNNIMHLFKVNTDGTVYVDGVYKGKSTTALPDGNYTMNIFRHSALKISIPARIYYCKIYNSTDDIIFDAIPVRIGSAGYMYDRVSGKLFGNKGTGNFILGPDVNTPIKRNVIYTGTNIRCVIATQNNTESEQDNNINNNTND